MSETIVRQGDTFRRSITLTYKQTGTIVDLTGCTAYSQMRSKPGEALCFDGDTSIDVATGKIIVTFAKEDMETLEPGDYGFDVRLEADNDRKTIYTERITVVLPYTEMDDDESL